MFDNNLWNLCSGVSITVDLKSEVYVRQKAQKEASGKKLS